jgi:hypothetical protein
MSTTAIKAGKAVVELSLRDQIDKGLNLARKKLQAFADGVKSIGSRIFTASALVAGGLGAFVAASMEIGGPLQDLIESTGATAEELTALKYAGEQTGVAIEDIGKSMQSLAKFTAAVASGSKAAKKTLDKMGISSAAFLAATPVQRLSLIADGLQRIEDPAIRSAYAMWTLGKQGFNMLRMLAGGSAEFEKLLNRASDLGVVISTEDIAKSDALGDSWAELVSQGKAIVFHVGNAFADVLLGVFDVMKPLATATIVAVQANKGLIVTLGTLAVVGMAVGTAIFHVGMFLQAVTYVISFMGMVVSGVTAAWSALIAVKSFLVAVNAALGAAMSMMTATTIASGFAAAFATVKTALLTAACSALGAVLSFITSPLFIVTTAILAISAAAIYGAYALFTYSEGGRAAVAGLGYMFGWLWQMAKAAFAGIMDAAMSGNWELVGKIMMAGLQVAWYTGIGALSTAWTLFVAGIKLSFADAMQGLLSIAFQTAKQLEKLTGMKIGTEGLAVLNQGLSNYKSGVNKQVGADIVGNFRDAQKAASELAKLRTQAAKERADKVDKFKLQIPTVKFSGAGLQDSTAGPEGGNFSTFSGFVAGMIGKVKVDTHAKRTADGVEKSNELLQQLIDEMEPGVAVGNE